MIIEPTINQIVDDEVDFYAHTLIGLGLQSGVWHKVGRSDKLGLDGLHNIVFGFVLKYIQIEPFPNIKEVNPLENWTLWKYGDTESIYVGTLTAEYINILEPGSVKPFVEIISRMKYGYYRYTNPAFEIIKRRPRPEVHSYTRVEGDDVVYYFHFLGENVVEEIVVENGMSALLTPQSPSAHGHTLREAPFYATNWKHREFITREEFEEAKSNCA